jgi:hypothetical protein
MEDNSDLIIKAFEILKIKIPLTKTLAEMVEELKLISKGPIMSKSEISVHDIIRDLIEAIEQKKSRENIEQILQRLKKEVNYCDYWD